MTDEEIKKSIGDLPEILFKPRYKVNLLAIICFLLAITFLAGLSIDGIQKTGELISFINPMIEDYNSLVDSCRPYGSPPNFFLEGGKNLGVQNASII